jgi:hypothetical protein
MHCSAATGRRFAAPHARRPANGATQRSHLSEAAWQFHVTGNPHAEKIGVRVAGSRQ